MTNIQDTDARNSEAPLAASPRRRSRAQTREELVLATLRVKNKGLKVSISAVAAEAGVTPALIHNTYPDIAEEIRAQVGRTTRQQRDAKAAELTTARAQLRAMRAELSATLGDVRRLASINETLREEIAMLRGAASGKVIVLSSQGSV